MAWQKVTSELTRANDGTLDGDTLPHMNWKWPEDTWLQQKRRERRNLRKEENSWPIKPPTDDSNLK
jgi:hypothetical protein